MPFIQYYNLPPALPRGAVGLFEQLAACTPALCLAQGRSFVTFCLLDTGLEALPCDVIPDEYMAEERIPAKFAIAMPDGAICGWGRLADSLVLVAALLPEPGDSRDGFAARTAGAAEDFIAMLEADYGISVSVSVSEPFHALADCLDAARDALVMADFARFIEEPVNVVDAGYYDGMKTLLARQNPEYRLVNYERPLIAAVLNNNFTHAELITVKYLIAHLCDPLHVFPSMHAAMLNMSRLVMSMAAIDPKAMSERDERFSAVQWHMQNCATLSEMKQAIHRFFQLVQSYVESEKELCSTGNKMQRIVDFINENYTDPQLDAGMVSDRFDITPSYLSRAFKEHMGVNLSAYLQTVRITAAKELLVGTDMTIERIAAEVGYAGGQTLLRLFKKFEGVNPSVYKSMARGAAGQEAEVKN